MSSAPREVTPPPIQAPTAKEKKYDRQLRLWAASGQRALEESHVLLVIGEDQHGSNSSVAGAETLKNLILPGIGNFTVSDSTRVQDSDLGINFFLESSSINKSRAEEVTRLLQELNPDVEGHAISTPITEWLSREDSLRSYNLIIACAPISHDILERLSNYALQSSIPLIYIQSVGFYASFSIQLPEEFPIVDTHPDPESIQDLRLLHPWPELEAAASQIDNLDNFSDHDHGHIPYVLLLLHYLKKWKEDHNSYPSTFKEKTQFRDFVRSGARTSNAEGGEENFDEACGAVLKSISEPPIGNGCKDMFELPSCQTLTPDSANFWVIANAVKTFHQKYGVLPLPGSLPDMKATSAEYVKLQNIYKSKARADVAEVTKTVRSIENSLSRATPIANSEIESFCKNASQVCVLTNPDRHPLPTLRLTQSDTKVITKLKNHLQDDYEATLPVFIALNEDILKLDTSTITEDEEIVDRISKTIEDVKRAKGGELHNISSITGGMVAQEAIKLLTRQYVPVDGTCVFDGIRSKSGVFKF